jgi:hypothetical protein
MLELERKEGDSMKPSEYGGSDTDKTHGIQPAPHALTASEKLRLAYSQDPAEPTTDLPPTLDPGALD